jgi:tetratricopeptide (TPR) repeat protein
MYGEVTKTPKYVQIDMDFINSAIKACGSADSAVRHYTMRGWQYYFSDSLDVSMKRFNQAWLINPKSPDVYFGFAALEEFKGDSIQAERFYNMALEKDINHNRAAVCYKKISECNEQLHNIRGALEARRKLATLTPNDAFTFRKIGYYESALNNHNAALEATNRAIELDQTDAMTYMNRGWEYYKLKKYPEAIADYSTSLKLDAQNVSAFVNRALAEEVSGNLFASKKDIEKAVSLVPTDGSLRRSLGYIKLSLKDTSGAWDDLWQAAQLGDSLAASLFKGKQLIQK